MGDMSVNMDGNSVVRFLAKVQFHVTPFADRLVILFLVVLVLVYKKILILGIKLVAGLSFIDAVTVDRPMIEPSGGFCGCLVRVGRFGDAFIAVAAV